MTFVVYIRRLFAGIMFLLLLPMGIRAKTVYDTDGCNVNLLFSKKNTVYVIRYAHKFNDTLFVPQRCKLYFDGGSLKGPIVFNNTELKGKVNLKGSSVFGHVCNKTFDASWICAMDGETDDARCINDMIRVCDRIHFPQGQYLLKSKFNPDGIVEKSLQTQVQTHIGINRSNVRLVGDEGSEFISDIPLGTIFVFSKPNELENSIRNIEISGLTFTVHNDGKEFHEFMHTIKLMGVNGMTIKNCRFDDFWGDAICLSHYGDTPETGERTRNQNVKILNNTIAGSDYHNNRNGISVINGKDVLIKGNTIKNTSRKDMPGGIDVEPNNSAYTIDNIRIEDNTFEDIKGSGGAICVVVLNDGPAHHVSIIGNRISRSSNGLFVYVKTEDTSDNFVIKNNVIASDTRPYYFKGSGKSRLWTISDNTFDCPCTQMIPGDIKVENLKVTNNKKKSR